MNKNPNINNFSLSIQLLVSLISVSLIFSCATRPKLKSRSEIISEAKSDGIAILTIEEEREKFYTHLKTQERRLIGLLRARSNPAFRNENYKFGAGDEIEIYVFDVEELNTTVRVRDSGFITLPLVGAIEAVNKTEKELVYNIKKRLKAFVRNPEVSLFISSYASQKVAVIGAVDEPGSYPIKKGRNSLAEFLSLAGGVSDKAGNFINFIPGEVLLNQLGRNEELSDPSVKARLSFNNKSTRALGRHVIEIDVARILGTDGSIPLDIPLKGGDMIIVPEAGGIAVEGEVKQPGSYDLKKGMTLVGGLAAGGGIGYSAQIDEVELIRKINAKKTLRLVLDLTKVASGEQDDVLLRNGDIIRVPTHSGRRISQDTFESIARLVNVGVGGTL